MMILDKMSGPLLKYYKQLKKDRSKEKDFAKGTCYFEENEGESKMNIALDDGKGKPSLLWMPSKVFTDFQSSKPMLFAN